MFPLGSAYSPAQKCLLGGGANSSHLGKAAPMLCCSPEPRLPPLTLAPLFPSLVPSSSSCPFPHGLLPTQCQALQLPFPLCSASVPHGVCSRQFPPEHGPPLLHPSPKHAHSLPDLLLAAAHIQHAQTPQRLCSCGFLTRRVFLQPPPTSHLLYFRPLLHTQPKSFGVNQPWFYALFCPLPVCALGQAA